MFGDDTLMFYSKESMLKMMWECLNTIVKSIAGRNEGTLRNEENALFQAALAALMVAIEDLELVIFDDQQEP
jgi:hypothetical protein